VPTTPPPRMTTSAESGSGETEPGISRIVRGALQPRTPGL
jgi:hypothetical protein